ncbi:flavodoxin [Carboxylicivirga sediminis]|uniref:Flavodoxin n=1 Tax=Carboxylicivirga sediminis TaxID=2006564 RepID=A0A941F050_9BACT|nr:flavodoxin [Carboxylicivirga sediminis]MBR8534097.1 flavodoxin [Carboxylicivirga sediminis]
MKKTAIVYGSSTGNTQAVAEMINSQLDNQADLINVDEASASDLANYDFLFLGTSTWGLGDLQDDWEGFITELQRVDLGGKQIALFGLGDADAYPDTFVDGMGTIYKAIAGKGCEVVGMVSVDDYSYDASTAELEGQLVGLAIDEDNESDKTQSRVESWIGDLRPHLD